MRIISWRKSRSMRPKLSPIHMTKLGELKGMAPLFVGEVDESYKWKSVSPRMPSNRVVMPSTTAASVPTPCPCLPIPRIHVWVCHYEIVSNVFVNIRTGVAVNVPLVCGTQKEVNRHLSKPSQQPVSLRTLSCGPKEHMSPIHPTNPTTDAS